LTSSVFRLALGTVQFGLQYGIANQSGQVTILEIKSILQTSMDNGIDTLDTAISYGESETRLGQVGVERWKVMTKLPAIPENCPDICTWIKEQVKISLKRLRITQLYCLLLHKPGQLLGKDGNSIFRALQLLKETGLIRKIGISIYDPSELNALTSKYHFDLVQAPFNLIDRRLLTSGWLDRLKCSSVEVHARSVFLQGLLLMELSAIPSQFSAWNGIWRKWHYWLDSQNKSAIEASLEFPLSFPEFDKIIVGIDNLIQLHQVLNSANISVKANLPNLECEDYKLINPAHWT